jgi:gluconokinase
MPPRVLALDIGTTSVRASLYDARLKRGRNVRLKYAWHALPDGGVELPADRVLRIVADAIDRVLDGETRAIDAVGVAAFWHSLVGVDRDGRAVTPLLPWSDTRASREAERLRDRHSERAIHRRTGCRLHPTYWPVRVPWIRRADPGAYRRVARWLSFTDLMDLRWLGREGTSVSQASGTGLLNQDTCEWDAATARACGVDTRRLPPILDLDAPGTLITRLKTRWPALAEARWLPGVGDGAANNVGAACVRRDRAAVMIGTSGALRTLWRPRRTERVRTNFGLWRYRLDRDRVVVGGALSNGGNVREWLLQTIEDTDGTRAAAEGMAPDSHGLTVLPFIAGTRSPDYLTDATATITGIRLATRPEHLVRAVMEAVAYRLARVFDELRDTVRPATIVAAGGALEGSAAWTQIIADVLQRPIELCAERELTSRGAAALALEQLGVLNVDRMPPLPSRTIEPNRGCAPVYRAAMQRQQQLFRRIHRQA